MKCHVCLDPDFGCLVNNQNQDHNQTENPFGRMNLLDIVHQYVLNACDSVWILHSKWHEVQRAIFPWVSIYL